MLKLLKTTNILNPTEATKTDFPTMITVTGAPIAQPEASTLLITKLDVFSGNQQ